MHKIRILIPGFLIFFVASAFFIFGQTLEENLRKGDEYYAQFNDQKALEEYLAAVQASPSNYEALWKVSRSYVDVGDLVDPKEKNYQEKQKKFYKEAEEIGRAHV